MVEFLHDTVALRLDEYRNKGGAVLAVESVPQIIETGKEYSPDILLPYANNQNFIDIFLSRLPPTGFALSGKGHRDIITSLRTDGEEYLLLVGNQTPGKKTLALHQEFAPTSELLDPESGRCFIVPENPWTFTLAEEQHDFRFAARSQSISVGEPLTILFAEQADETTAIVLTVHGISVSGDLMLQFQSLNYVLIRQMLDYRSNGLSIRRPTGTK